MNKARIIVEGLRSGIPYRETARAFTLGRTASMTAVERWLEHLENHRPIPSYGMIVRAQYGEGKTHLLHALSALAADRNWLVSMVSLSKETPLDRLDHVYPKIMSNLYRPGSNQPGLEAVIREALVAPKLAADSRQLEVSDRVRAVLDNLIQQDHGFDALIEDLSGRFLTLAELKRIARDNFGRPLKLAASRIKEEIADYFRLVDWLIAHTEYQGLLILFDEVELIGKFGRGGRARSYVSMGSFLQGVGDRIMTIWAVAGNFQTDVIIPRKDHELIGQWLLARPKDADGVDQAKLALDELSTAKPLDPLTSDQVRAMFEEILALHEQAYDWNSGFDAQDFYQAVRAQMQVLDAPLRTWIRLGITLLDMRLQYGETGAVTAEVVGEIDLSEDRSFERDTPEDDRPWLSGH